MSTITSIWVSLLVACLILGVTCDLYTCDETDTVYNNNILIINNMAQASAAAATLRGISQVIKAVPTSDGAGVRLMRTIGTRKLDSLIELARASRKAGRAALEDTSVRRELAACDTRIEAMRLNGMRNLTRQLKGDPPSSETSVNKLLRGALEIRMAELSLEVLGSSSQLEGPWQNASLSFHGTVIGGGTPNIQRNIIAERILGLPKD